MRFLKRLLIGLVLLLAAFVTVVWFQPDDYRLTRPFAGTSNADFVFSEAGGQTNVIWSMFGQQNFIGKAMCLVMSMETMLGPDVEKGLAQLKQVSEGK